MITIILLALIYLAFISLGLPDSILGVTWPAMQLDWGLRLDAVGLVSMFITGSTIISSLLSGRITKKLGTGKVVLFSCIMTGLALLGMSFVPSYFWLILLAIPLGFGAGSVDAALNGYVAQHFKAHHMNWLHSFWGVGATIGPLIIAGVLTNGGMWRGGYRIISLIQLSLAALLLISLPIWSKHHKISNLDIETHCDKEKNHIKKSIFKIKGVSLALATFLFYCAVEVSIGLWGSSFLVNTKGLSIETAASWIAMYYGGITIGRFISGFISFKLSNTQMIRAGIIISFVSALLLLLPLPKEMLFISFMLIGLGLAPIFPSMLHETPRRFGENRAQEIIGFQVAFAYIGSTFLPPLFGVLANITTIKIFPFYIVGGLIIMFLCTEFLTYISKSNKQIDT